MANKKRSRNKPPAPPADETASELEPAGVPDVDAADEIAAPDPAPQPDAAGEISDAPAESSPEPEESLADVLQRELADLHEVLLELQWVNKEREEELAKLRERESVGCRVCLPKCTPVDCGPREFVAPTIHAYRPSAKAYRALASLMKARHPGVDHHAGHMALALTEILEAYADAE